MFHGLYQLRQIIHQLTGVGGGCVAGRGGAADDNKDDDDKDAEVSVEISYVCGNRVAVVDGNIVLSSVVGSTSAAFGLGMIFLIVTHLVLRSAGAKTFAASKD